MSDYHGVGPAFKPDEPRLGPAEVDNLVVYLLAMPRVAQAARADLLPEYFSLEPHYKLLWVAMQGLFASYGEGAVPYDAAYMHVRGAAEASPTPLPLAAWYQILATPDVVGSEMIPGDPASVVQQVGVIHYAYKQFDPKDASPEYGLDLLRRFIHERGVLDEVSRLGSQVVGRRPGNFEAALKLVGDRQARVSSLGMPLAHGFDAFPEDVEPVPVFTTGSPFLNHFLDGGHAGGEVYGAIGPQKAGKSFLAVNICNGSAEHFTAVAAAGGELRHAILATYELSFAEFRPRVLACGAAVSQTRLTKEISQKNGVYYSTRGNLLPYEVEMYRRKKEFDVATLNGERERIEAFMRGPGRALKVLDMTGKDGARGRGYGGVEELAGMVRQLDGEGVKPGVLVVDYLHKAVRRQLASEGKDSDRYLRSYLMEFIVQTIDKIAAPFNIPVWLLAQYSAEGQRARPTKQLKATDAAESRTMGENCNAVFCMGTVDESSKVLQIACDLCRRTDKAGQTRLIRLDYEMATFLDVTGMYDADENNGCFVPKDVARAAAAVDPRTIAVATEAPRAVDPYAGEAAEKAKSRPKAAAARLDDEPY